MTDQELVELAFTMLERSYVPYSHFPVGAALECADPSCCSFSKEKSAPCLSAK